MPLHLHLPLLCGAFTLFGRPQPTYGVSVCISSVNISDCLWQDARPFPVVWWVSRWAHWRLIALAALPWVPPRHVFSYVGKDMTSPSEKTLYHRCPPLWKHIREHRVPYHKAECVPTGLTNSSISIPGIARDSKVSIMNVVFFVRNPRFPVLGMPLCGPPKPVRMLKSDEGFGKSPYTTKRGVQRPGHLT